MMLYVNNSSTMQSEGSSQILSELLQHVHKAYGGLQTIVESIANNEKFQGLWQMVVQQWLAAASCVASLALLLGTVAAGTCWWSP